MYSYFYILVIQNTFYVILLYYVCVIDSILILLKMTVKHCKNMIPNIGDISIPKIIGIVPLNSFRYGSVNLFKEQKGSLYQLTVGNHANDNFKRINIKYISEKLAIDVNIKFNE